MNKLRAWGHGGIEPLTTQKQVRRTNHYINQAYSDNWNVVQVSDQTIAAKAVRAFWTWANPEVSSKGVVVASTSLLHLVGLCQQGAVRAYLNIFCSHNTCIS